LTIFGGLLKSAVVKVHHYNTCPGGETGRQWTWSPSVAKDTTAWMQRVRLQEVIGRVESGTETENESGDRVEESESDRA